MERRWSAAGHVVPVAILACMMLAWPAAASQAAENRPVVFVGDFDYSPLKFIEDGKPKGVLVDIMREVAKRMHRTPEIRLMAWNRALSQVTRGEADAVCGMSITEARRKTFDFSDPVYDSRYSIFVRSGTLGVTKLSDLRGFRVGVRAGGLNQKAVESEPQIKMYLMDDYLKGFRMLKDGKLDAVVADIWIGTYILAKHDISQVRHTGDPILDLKSAFAVRKGNAALLAEINEAIRSLRNDGTIDRIYATWQPAEVVFRTREQILRSTYNWTVGLLALLLVFSSIWIIILRREISRRHTIEATLRESEARYRTLSDEYKRLNDIFITFSEARDVADLFRIIADQLRMFTGAKRVLSTMYDRADSSLRVVAVSVDAVVVDAVESILGVPMCDLRIPVHDGSKKRMLSEVLMRSSSLAELTSGALSQETSTRIFEAIGCSEAIALALHNGPDLLGTAMAFMPPGSTGVPADTLMTFGHMAGMTVTRKKTEEELVNLNLELEQKVSRRTGELKKAYDDIMTTNHDLEKAMQDLTNTQVQLVKSEKLSALGQLAAGIAHELNTPLGAIMSSNRSMIDIMQHKISETARMLCGLREDEAAAFNVLLAEGLERATRIGTSAGRKEKRDIARILENTDLPAQDTLVELIMSSGVYGLKERLPDLLKIDRRVEVLSSIASLSSIRSLGEIIALASEKATHVVRALQNYLKQDADEDDETLVNIQEEIETILTLYQNKLKHGVTVKKNFTTYDPVQGSRGKLNQLWMNLLNNALQAIDYRGTVEIETERRDSWILVSITDSGAGIPEEIREKIFEPFFSTKKHGEGMGLGLDICRKIAEKHGGRIEFESVPGRTRFSVWLKAVRF